MGNSVFDLSGQLTVDTSQLESLGEDVHGQLAEVDGRETTARLSVDDRQAKSSLSTVEVQAKGVRREIERPHKLRVDTSAARADMSGWGTSLRGIRRRARPWPCATRAASWR